MEAAAAVKPLAAAAVLAVVALGLVAVPLLGQVPYSRPVDLAPDENAIGDSYETPEVQRPLPRSVNWQIFDLALLAAALGGAAWIVLGRRSRAATLALTVGCLAYFGFFARAASARSARSRTSPPPSSIPTTPFQSTSSAFSCCRSRRPSCSAACSAAACALSARFRNWCC